MSKLTTAWFHEDDFCQIELLPGKTKEWIRTQNADAIDRYLALRSEVGKE